jgi:hypothetical protein
MGRFEEGADKLRPSFDGGQLRFDFFQASPVRREKLGIEPKGNRLAPRRL